MAQSIVTVEVKAAGAEGTAMTTCAPLTYSYQYSTGLQSSEWCHHSGQDVLLQLPNQIIRLILNKHGLTSKSTC